MEQIPDIVGYLRAKYAQLALTKKELDAFIILDTNLDILFPPLSDIKHYVHDIEDMKAYRQELKQTYNRCRVQDFTFYMHDYEWMYRYIKQRLDFLCKGIGRDLDKKAVCKFFSMSSSFRKKRDEYANEVLKTCLDFCLRSYPDSTFFGKFTEREFKSVNYDKIFYQHMVGLCRDLQVCSDLQVAKFMEDNADKWRIYAQVHTFTNNYTKKRPEAMSLPTKLTPEIEQLNKIEDRLFKKWIVLREYEYGREHAYVLKKIEVFTPNMLLKPEEVEKLKSEVAALEREYFMYLNVYQKSNIQPELFTPEDLLDGQEKGI